MKSLNDPPLFPRERFFSLLTRCHRLDTGPIFQVQGLQNGTAPYRVEVLLGPLLGSIFILLRDEMKTATRQQLTKQPADVLWTKGQDVLR